MANADGLSTGMLGHIRRKPEDAAVIVAKVLPYRGWSRRRATGGRGVGDQELDLALRPKLHTLRKAIALAKPY